VAAHQGLERRRVASADESLEQGVVVVRDRVVELSQ
jgi:hypothetical protein